MASARLSGIARRGSGVHVHTTRRNYKDKVYESHLLRRSYREDGKVKNETLANLSHLPSVTIEVIRESLAGKSHVVAGGEFEIERSLFHGHVAAIAAMANKLKLASLLGPESKERDIILALVIARVTSPSSKLATTRWWQDTTIACDFGVGDASTDDLYGAMDWILQRQGAIETQLSRRHLTEGSQQGGTRLRDSAKGIGGWQATKPYQIPALVRI
ncbi:hypothetical protein [Acidithrix sp. C25]|uniref:hypothetical protein n=1 Tax=Acidithrix sp. C25 TaxID=1671482 RepID=UPI00191BA7AD|nr:hypothetical protein [Acidithrix sp. C25]